MLSLVFKMTVLAPFRGLIYLFTRGWLLLACLLVSMLILPPGMTMVMFVAVFIYAIIAGNVKNFKL